MKFSLICFLVFQIHASKTPVIEIEEIRVLFHQAGSSQKICTDLIKKLEPFNERNNPLFLGYKASATMMMAKYVINPFSKLQYFKKGKLMLEKAIELDPRNIELRFLRYTIQTNIPAFLNYSSNQEPDRLFLYNSISELKDQKLKRIISAYLKTVKSSQS